jgi:RNA polymerase sigma-70 factor (sigma-E family)
LTTPSGHEDIDAFCRRMSPRLVGSLSLQCDGRAVAEELAQEALVRAWERWNEVGRMASPDGWVFRVAFNLASSERRRRQAERRAIARVEPSTHVSDSADHIALREVLRALPPRQRAAVVLRYYTGFSVAEAAVVLGCAEGTVKSLTSQGVERIRSTLSLDEGAIAGSESPDASATGSAADG